VFQRACRVAVAAPIIQSAPKRMT